MDIGASPKQPHTAMPRVVVPVRYPLTPRSRRTLKKAIDIADDEDADLTILHVNLYQLDRNVTRTDLKTAVERSFGQIPRSRYVVRPGFIVEQTILDEIAAEDADIVVVGRAQVGRFRRLLRSVLDEPNVDAFLRREVDCEIITVTDA